MLHCTYHMSSAADLQNSSVVSDDFAIMTASKYKTEVKGLPAPIRKLNTNLKTLVRNSPSMHNNRMMFEHVCEGDISMSSVVPPAGQRCVCVECQEIFDAVDMSFVFSSTSFMGWLSFCLPCSEQVSLRSGLSVATIRKNG